MDNLKQTINLLRAVKTTMDTISVIGIDNQDKFVGCAHAVRAAVEGLEAIRATEKVDMRSVDAPQPDAETQEV